MNIKSKFSILVILLLFFQACTIEKRVYQSGYHIDWHFSKDKTLAKQTTESVRKLKHLEQPSIESKSDIKLTINSNPIIINNSNPIFSHHSLKDNLKSKPTIKKQIIKKALIKSKKMNNQTNTSINTTNLKDNNSNNFIISKYAIICFVLALIGLILPFNILAICFFALSIIFGYLGFRNTKGEFNLSKLVLILGLLISVFGFLNILF